MLSSAQQAHKSNHCKSLSQSQQEIRALINLRTTFLHKLKVTINPFIAQRATPHQHHLCSREGREEVLSSTSTADGCKLLLPPGGKQRGARTT